MRTKMPVMKVKHSVFCPFLGEGGDGVVVDVFTQRANNVLFFKKNLIDIWLQR
jgi:hypothetical protein